MFDRSGLKLPQIWPSAAKIRQRRQMPAKVDQVWSNLPEGWPDTASCIGPNLTQIDQCWSDWAQFGPNRPKSNQLRPESWLPGCNCPRRAASANLRSSAIIGLCKPGNFTKHEAGVAADHGVVALPSGRRSAAGAPSTIAGAHGNAESHVVAATPGIAVAPITGRSAFPELRPRPLRS